MWEVFGAVAVFGAATAFESPAAAALLPAVAPEGMLQKGTALSTAGFQVEIFSNAAECGEAGMKRKKMPRLEAFLQSLTIRSVS